MVLVSGGMGFIGGAFSSKLSSSGFKVRCAVRDPLDYHNGSTIDYVSVGNICSKTDWSQALKGIKTIVHCAALNSRVNNFNASALSTYRSVNVDGTRRLAEQAINYGVQRFVFLSSIKVNGELTDVLPFSSPKKRGEVSNSTYNDSGLLRDPYSISKFEAEQALWDVSAKTGLEVVVVRPPMVYGPCVKGNLALLIKLVSSGLPLPFGLVRNHRSLIGLDNLIDFLILCINHPAAAGETFLVSDGQDVSTPELVQYIATAMGKTAFLTQIPVPLLRALGHLFRRQADISRLIDSLQVDSSHAQVILNWVPPVSLKEGVRRMVQMS
jgi:nucleoside-diphosphate-sugar epimerase